MAVTATSEAQRLHYLLPNSTEVLLLLLRMLMTLGANCTAVGESKRARRIVKETQPGWVARHGLCWFGRAMNGGSFAQGRCQVFRARHFMLIEEVTCPQQKRFATLQLGLPLIIK